MSSKLSSFGLIVIVILALATPAHPTSAQSAAPPLASPGPYQVGSRTMTFVDTARKGRELVTEIWYPAVVPEARQAEAALDSRGLRDAPPDSKGAPYPLILYSHGASTSRMELRYLMFHLASHGFVVAAMDHADSDSPSQWAVDRPLDVLFVLDQLATKSKGDLAGMVDADHLGVAGYSRGAFTTIQLTGAQNDPTYHVEWCGNNPTVYPYVCPVSSQLKQWPPFADKRILAALPITGAPGPVFGERGLASATVPTLLLAGTADTAAPYEWAAVFVYKYLGSKDRYLITFVNADHMFGYNASSRLSPLILHFATAFFGLYVQGKQDYAQYLTAKYVNSLEKVGVYQPVWGVYAGK